MLNCRPQPFDDSAPGDKDANVVVIVGRNYY